MRDSVDPRPCGPTGPAQAVREVVVVVYDGVQLLDAAGPLEVFSSAGGLRDGAYRVRLASVDGRDVVTSSGIRLGVHLRLPDAEPDTLLVAGGWGHGGTACGAELTAQVRLVAGRARRIASVCTGAFVLAEAGLLDGRRATTHWALCEELAAEHPSVSVEPDAIFVRDGPVVTSAGVSAGVDLALALVEEDHGAALSREVAKWLVVFLQRPGGQSQFSLRNRAPALPDGPPRALLDDIAVDPAADLSVQAMAARLSMSPRHFSRMFTRRVGTSPGRYVERARVEAAREMLESGAEGVRAVARRCGFNCAETMRRTFLREIGVPPSAYRSRFSRTGIEGPTARDGTRGKAAGGPGGEAGPPAGDAGFRAP